jgi:hypothetical protein
MERAHRHQLGLAMNLDNGRDEVAESCCVSIGSAPMIFARKRRMELKRPVPKAPAKRAAADAEQPPGEQRASQDAEVQSAELPSFAPLPRPARPRGWSGSQLLVLVCAFAAGVAVGVGGTRLLDTDLSVGAYLETMLRPQTPMPDMASARRSGVETSPLPAAAPPSSPYLAVGEVPRDGAAAPGSTDNPEVSSEVSALKGEVERQLAEGWVDKPEHNNALDTYRKMAAIAPNDPATIALGGHLSAVIWTLANRARSDARLDEALHYYGILKTLPPVPLAAILAKQSPEPSVPERDASPGVGPAVSSLPEAAAAPPTPVVVSEATEPTKPPNAAPAAPIVMSAPAADAPRPEPVTAPLVAQLSGPVRSTEPTNPRDVAHTAPIVSSPPDMAAPLTTTAPMASMAGPTPPGGAGSAAASSGPPGNQAPDQSALRETATSRDLANAGPVATPAPAVSANEAASPRPVRGQPLGHGTSNAPAASRDVANAGPIVSSPNDGAAPGPKGASTIIAIAMARGEDALAAGDVISARQFYELAASNGFAHAATAVGQTYDPNFLQGKGVRGALADAEAAKQWYQKAIDGGDVEARMRLDKLLKSDQGTIAR